jgi:hypothetical protein
MKDGQCSECSSGEVYYVESVEMGINIGAFKEAPLAMYVCASCGYVALYVRKSELLPKIAEKYMSVRELKEIAGEGSA